MPPRPSNGPTWALSPRQWGAQEDYDKWTDTYTPDDGVALHHGGGSNYRAGRAPFSQGEEMAQLRGWERYHIQTKGWRGLAYGWGLGQTGTVYRIRGWSTYGAHTGDVDGDGIANNREIIPIIFIGSGNWHELSPAAIDSLVRLRRYLEAESDRTLILRGHTELRGTVTSCPGPNLMRYVKTHRLLPEAPRMWTHPKEPNEPESRETQILDLNDADRVDAYQGRIAVAPGGNFATYHADVDQVSEEEFRRASLITDARMIDEFMRQDIRIRNLEGR